MEMDNNLIELNNTNMNELEDSEDALNLNMQSENIIETKSNFATIVEVSVLFLSIGEIDTMNEKYQAEICIESRWSFNDPILADPSFLNLRYDPNNHWNPQLYIENALSDVKETITYRIIQSYDGYYVNETRHLKGSFWERLELQTFPLDIQELSLTITTKFSRDEVKLTSNLIKLSSIDPEALNTFRDQQKWISFL
jgi:hypothetical protein